MRLSIVPLFRSRRAVSDGGPLLSVAYHLTCFMTFFERVWIDDGSRMDRVRIEDGSRGDRGWTCIKLKSKGGSGGLVQLN